MAGMTKERIKEVKATAAQLIKQLGGSEAIDKLSIEAAKGMENALVLELQAREGVVRDTARKRIAQALRQDRKLLDKMINTALHLLIVDDPMDDPDEKSGQWGGKREKKEEETTDT